MRKLLLLAVLVPVWAQEPPKAEAPKPHRAMPEPKNLQVLKIPNSELIPIMRVYSSSLGVKCGFCHVEGNFASDDKQEKKTARMMITMTQDINGKFGDGGGNKARVSCYTCHRGEEEPKTAPPAGAEAPKPGI